jgi:hypothetical protein
VEETLHDDLLGSARGSRAPSGNSPDGRVAADTRREQESFRRLAEKSTRAACVPRKDSPLAAMTLPERVQADYEGMNLTTGPHPMKLVREQLPDVWRANDLAQARHGSTVQIAGNAIAAGDYRRTVSRHRRRSAEYRQRRARESEEDSAARPDPSGRERVARFSLGGARLAPSVNCHPEPAQRGKGPHKRQKSSTDRSAHRGLSVSTSAFFLLRRQPLISFSRTMASSMRL